MQIPKDKTLFHDTKEGITLWIILVNQETGLFDILISDKELNATYRVAEYDGSKYNVLNRRVFGGVFYKMAKDNPSIISNIRSYITLYKPENNGFTAMCSRLADRFTETETRTKKIIQRIWNQKKKIN